MNPKISLIIAVYNRPEALSLIFEALIRQRFKCFEVLIADDGSGKEIADLVTQWQVNPDYNIRHIRHDDNGFRKTIIINKAVLASRGEYLVFIDGDCIPHHLFLSDHWMRRERDVVLAGRRVMVSGKKIDRITSESIRTGAFESPWQWQGAGNELHTGQYAFRIPPIDPWRNKKRDDFFILGSNFSLHRSTFNALNGYDERIIGRGMEDNNLHARVIAAKIPIRSLSQVALQYHLFHTSDPIPHSAETVREFCTVTSGWTNFGMIKSEE